MKKGWFPLIYLVAALATLTGPAPAPAGERVAVPGGSYVDITSAELSAMLMKKDFFFANVHIPYEGEIAGTDAHIPFNQMEQNLQRLPRDKGGKIVLYCRSGPMSATASQILVRQGYTNILNLAGGMQAWKKAGYSLLDRQKGHR